MEMSTNNPHWNSVVLESSVKPSLRKHACPSLVDRKIQETTDSECKTTL